MADIKFRLRSRKNTIVGYEKWYTGSWYSAGDYYKAKPCWLCSEDGKHWTPDPIYHVDKDTFTGVKDKNGKEIYGGDAVNMGMKEIFIIESRPGVFMARCTTRKFMLGVGANGHAMEIIGNIHENPELVPDAP